MRVISGQYGVDTTWQWQLQGKMNKDIAVDLYDIDLFDNSYETIASLKNQGKTVICYYSAGSYENWRPDADEFPENCLGKPLEGWEGEKWIDFTCSEILDIMSDRLDLASSKGCDGVEPDNVDGYTQKSGFSLSYNDQITYNKWTASEAHNRGLSVALKNDVEQIPDLVDHYDFAINEECHTYNECGTYKPFTSANKAVFNTEYEISSQNEFDDLCAASAKFQLSSIAKTWDLNSPLCSCLAPESNYNCDQVLAQGGGGGGGGGGSDDNNEDGHSGFKWQWYYWFALLLIVPVVGGPLWCCFCRRGKQDEGAASSASAAAGAGDSSSSLDSTRHGLLSASEAEAAAVIDADIVYTESCIPSAPPSQY